MKKLSLYVFLVLIIFQTNIYADNEKKKIIVLTKCADNSMKTLCTLFFHLSLLWFPFLNCDNISKKYFSNPKPQHDLNTIDDYLDIECVLNYFILLYLATGLFCLPGRLLINKSLSCELHF